VDDLLTGQKWSIGEGPPQDEASIVKVDVLADLLSQQSGGTVLSGEDGTLAQEMIEYSTNAATTDLWNAAGGTGAIAAFDAEVGMTDTTPSSCVQCPDFPWPGWGLTSTTATDQIRLLRSIVQPSRLLTDTQRAYVLGLMEHVTPSQSWGVSDGVPSGVTVALKDGWLPLQATDTDWQINSVGWVYGQRQDYLIAVLTTGNPTEQYGIDTVDELSALVWQGLD
jgi:beta-lactamase class A